MNTYLTLPEHLYAAVYRHQVVLLDIFNNKYISLSGNSAAYFCFVLQRNFSLDKNLAFYEKLKEFSEEITFSIININHLNFYVTKFVKEGFLEETSLWKRKNNLASAINPIGLSKMEWMIPDKSIEFDTTIPQVLVMFFKLIKVHRVMDKGGLKGISDYLNTKKRTHYKPNDSIPRLNNLSKTLDFVCALFPKKTLCLPWASTLACSALAECIPCDLVIGIQTAPFYAHAWVEHSGIAINEDQEVKEKLAPIFRLSFK